MNKITVLISITILLISSNILFASDMSEAEQLRIKCQNEFKAINICVNNFGDNNDKSDLKKAEKMLKMGKVKIAQTKYKDAIGYFNSYLKLQHTIYTSISKKYMKRTTKMLDDIGLEMVDYIDNPKISQYLKLASQNLKEADNNMKNNYYKIAIQHCRTSKKFLLACYPIAKMKLPPQYLVDKTDNAKKIQK